MQIIDILEEEHNNIIQFISDAICVLRENECKQINVDILEFISRYIFDYHFEKENKIIDYFLQKNIISPTEKKKILHTRHSLMCVEQIIKRPFNMIYENDWIINFLKNLHSYILIENNILPALIRENSEMINQEKIMFFEPVIGSNHYLEYLLKMQK